ncbi:signal peptide peptidase-like 3 isoform X2 [Physcomitrium patens]|uniref:signal peptide peptidase-like 3 isoform X2 n=1 Tax=Physcomitrium patens TaxID=3218 RepID=UPI000D15F10A|nr:signal peptide peptidase-like 4 isoform X3 [Physcomitrium patens]|eukprot:XP_024383688.1 signal peptide peptidase-like 4 isoform X3 [Physcomitrella patens]
MRDNLEVTELVGVSARFGVIFTDRNVKVDSIPLAIPRLAPSCKTSSIPLNGYAALVRRGECTFTRMARTVQAAGAKALVVVNNEEGARRL